jgi:hypothetical protein
MFHDTRDRHIHEFKHTVGTAIEHLPPFAERRFKSQYYRVRLKCVRYHKPALQFGTWPQITSHTVDKRRCVENALHISGTR